MSKTFNLIGGGSGGLVPTIVVHAPTGSTVSCDGKTNTEVSGTWTFRTTIGSHTITATNGTKTKTQTVVVDKIGLFTTNIDYEPSVLVPTLTSNSWEDGSVIWSGINSSDPTTKAYYAFDNNTSTHFSPEDATGAWVGVHFNEAKTIENFKMKQPNGGNVPSQITIDYSSNGTEWTTLQTYTYQKNTDVQSFTVSSPLSAEYWRIRITANYMGNHSGSITELQFYG